MEDSKKPTILIVDDDDLFRQFVRFILEKKLKVNVYTFRTPKEGFEFLEKQIPDLILLDMQMPVMDGYTFMKTLRANSQWKDVHVIPCTGIISRELLASLLQLNIDDYILKPTTEKILIEKINRALSRIGKTNIIDESKE